MKYILFLLLIQLVKATIPNSGTYEFDQDEIAPLHRNNGYISTTSDLTLEGNGYTLTSGATCCDDSTETRKCGGTCMVLLNLEGGTVTVNNLRLLHNGIPKWDGQSGSEAGAIITMRKGHLYMTNCTLEGGDAYRGGAIYAYFYTSTSTGTLSLTNTTFKNNKALSGGAIYIGNQYFDLIINGGTFINNRADAAWTDVYTGQVNKYEEFGGAITISHAKSISITNTIFEDNESLDTSGALHIIAPNKPFDIIGCTFKNNKAKNGGAIYTGNNGNGYLERCIFKDNEAEIKGGAIWFSMGYRTYDIEYCIFDGNEVTSTTEDFPVPVTNADIPKIVGGAAIYIGSDTNINTGFADGITIIATTFKNNIDHSLNPGTIFTMTNVNAQADYLQVLEFINVRSDDDQPLIYTIDVEDSSTNRTIYPKTCSNNVHPNYGYAVSDPCVFGDFTGTCFDGINGGNGVVCYCAGGGSQTFAIDRLFGESTCCGDSGCTLNSNTYLEKLNEQPEEEVAKPPKWVPKPTRGTPKRKTIKDTLVDILEEPIMNKDEYNETALITISGIAVGMLILIGIRAITWKVM